jgi:hypothetical protein
MDAEQELTPELASRMAVIAAAADLEFWARTTSVGGFIGLNDLTRALDLMRAVSAPMT